MVASDRHHPSEPLLFSVGEAANLSFFNSSWHVTPCASYPDATLWQHFPNEKQTVKKNYAVVPFGFSPAFALFFLANFELLPPLSAPLSLRLAVLVSPAPKLGSNNVGVAKLF